MRARYLLSASGHEGLPKHGLLEIAFAGRSNVGKSSVLGVVLGHPSLVRTSRTPGRTQALNLFEADGQYALVDLPGYGYAKLSKQQRAKLGRMIREYLTYREGLAGVVLILDARRSTPSELDRTAVQEIVEAERQLLVVLNKIDLIPKPKRLHQVRTIERALALPKGAAVPFSAKTGEGRDVLRAALWELRSA